MGWWLDGFCLFTMYDVLNLRFWCWHRPGSQIIWRWSFAFGVVCGRSLVGARGINFPRLVCSWLPGANQQLSSAVMGSQRVGGVLSEACQWRLAAYIKLISM